LICPGYQPRCTIISPYTGVEPSGKFPPWTALVANRRQKLMSAAFKL
jgi:hypothetical protein